MRPTELSATAELPEATPDYLAPTLTADDASIISSGPATEVAHPLVGTTLGGRYEIVDFIGSGGMGEVYRARDRELDDIVAVKVLRATLSGRSELVERFRNEVKLARRVTHRAVARTFELGEADGVRFLTMEYVEGESLARLQARHGPFSADTCARIAAEVCDALDAAHAAGIVHRDIKPDNILMTRAGRAVVTDFGVAQLASEQSRDTAGTPTYMAPEQVRGEPPTPQSDLYSLGATMFEMVTGRAPFDGATPLATMVARLDRPPPDVRHHCPDLSAGFADLVRSAMAVDPKGRFASAKEMRAACLALSGRRSLHPSAVDVQPTAVRSRPWTLVEVAPIERAPVELDYLTSALHAEITLGLGRVPLVRVVARIEESDSVDVTVTSIVIDKGARVLVRAVRRASQEEIFTARFPLGAHRLPEIADAVQTALSLALDVSRRSLGHDHEESEAYVLDLCLRARHHYAKPVEAEAERARDMYRIALQHAPNHPRALAGLAMSVTRHAFFAQSGPSSLAEAEAACSAALVSGADRPEPHLAAGHLALHTSDPIRAARFFRDAVAIAPAWPEAHEWLGRMLVEAGAPKDGAHRLEQAMRLDPGLSDLRWEIARSHALEGAWSDYDREAAQILRVRPSQRWFGRIRFSGWRKDRSALTALAAQIEGLPEAEIFDAAMCRATLETNLDGNWRAHASLFEARVAERWASVRRTIFYAQIATELACVGGDLETAERYLSRATELGLFDIAWADGCPLLVPLRERPAYGGIRAVIATRAQGVFDALYRS